MDAFREHIHAATAAYDALLVRLQLAEDARPVPKPVRKPFAVDPAFTPDSLSAAQRVWYDRLWSAIKLRRHDATAVAVGTLDAENVGFTCREYVNALAHGLNAIGAPALLEEIRRYMALIRNRSPFQMLNGKDLAFLGSFYSFVALIFSINEDDAESAFWLEETYLLMSIRNERRIVPSDNLAHPLFAAVETGFNLYDLTGDVNYLAQANRFLAVFMGQMKFADDGASFWDKRMPITATHPALGIERTTYLPYVLSSWANLAVRDIPTLPRLPLIAQVLKCTHDAGPLTELNDGTGLEASKTKQHARNFGAIIPFDESGDMVRRNAAYWKNTPAAYTEINIAAFQLYATEGST